MLTRNQIIKNVNDYEIKDGKVFKKADATLVDDEDLVLEVKSSYFLVKEAATRYKEDVIQFGKPMGDKNYYLDVRMEEFALQDQVNVRGANKLINALLNCNGYYKSDELGDDFTVGKYSMFFGKKKDYGIAYLRMKLRERGLDCRDFNINVDRSRFVKDGYSVVEIKFKVLKHEKVTFHHPQAELLTELEQMKGEAKRSDDEIAYNYYANQIRNVIVNNQVMLMSEEFDALSTDDKMRFFQIKMQESVVLNDPDAYNYWKANLVSLKEAEVGVKQGL